MHTKPTQIHTRRVLDSSKVHVIRLIIFACMQRTSLLIKASTSTEIQKDVYEHTHSNTEIA